MSEELYTKAQQAAEDHLDACLRAFEAESEGEDDVDWPELAAPFDGCMTCQVRETLHAAEPFMRAIVEAESSSSTRH